MPIRGPQVDDRRLAVRRKVRTVSSKAGLLGPPHVTYHRSAGQPGDRRERDRATTTARKATGPRRPTSARMRVHDRSSHEIPRRPRASQSKITITACAVRAAPARSTPIRQGVAERPLLAGPIDVSPNLLTWQFHDAENIPSARPSRSTPGTNLPFQQALLHWGGCCARSAGPAVSERTHR